MNVRKWKYDRIKNRTLNIGFDLATYIILAVTVFPFIWLILTAFKYPIDNIAYPPIIIPSRITVGNFVEVLSMPLIKESFSNSTVVAISTTVLSVFVGSLAAYGLARVRLPFRLNHIIALWILITRMYPAIATGVPYFFIIRNLKLLDTRVALIITYTSFNLPLVVWVMLGYFQSVPISIEEAAIIDGCSMWQRFSRIAMPISAPAIVATAILSFILAWNEFLFAVILTSVRARTLPVVISGFVTDKALLWGQMSALGVLLVLPVVALAWTAQKYLVRGLTMGAVTG